MLNIEHLVGTNVLFAPANKKGAPDGIVRGGYLLPGTLNPLHLLVELSGSMDEREIVDIPCGKGGFKIWGK